MDFQILFLHSMMVRRSALECYLAFQRAPVYSRVTCEKRAKSANTPLEWTGPVLYS